MHIPHPRLPASGLEPFPQITPQTPTHGYLVDFMIQ
jgi:hypothetical protein